MHIAVRYIRQRIYQARTIHRLTAFGLVICPGILALGGTILINAGAGVSVTADAAWWRKAPGTGSVLTLLCGMTVALCLLFRREIQRRMAAEAGLREAAEHLALLVGTDRLTGLVNRRGFEERLALEWLRSIRTESPIALLILDADHFRLFNDRHGHPAGEQALRSIAVCVAGNLMRPGDMSARYGGDEFMALLPETELAGALRVAERLRTAVAQLNIPHRGHPVGHVTVSIGVAVANPASGKPPASLVALAAEALHDARDAGRNRVSIAGLHDLLPVDWTQTRVTALGDSAV